MPSGPAGPSGASWTTSWSGGARVYVESREAASRESGDVIAAGEIAGEIGEVIAGTRPGRRTEREITLFKSVGVAVEDVVAAEMVYRKATAMASA